MVHWNLIVLAVHWPWSPLEEAPVGPWGRNRPPQVCVFTRCEDPQGTRTQSPKENDVQSQVIWVPPFVAHTNISLRINFHLELCTRKWIIFVKQNFLLWWYISTLMICALTGLNKVLSLPQQRDNVKIFMGWTIVQMISPLCSQLLCLHCGKGSSWYPSYE